MNSGTNDCQRISRRVVFTGTALALGAAAAATVVSEATAQEKISQADAKYQGTPKGDQRCDGCILFQPRTSWYPLPRRCGSAFPATRTNAATGSRAKRSQSGSHR